MSWSDYHLDHPGFCTPLPVLRGLVSALCERREAVDSGFYSSCTVSSGARAAAYAHQLADTVLLAPGVYSLSPKNTEDDVLFRPVARCSDTNSSYTFMEHFDAELETLVESGAYTDSSGAVYSSLEQLASSAGYSALIAPEGGVMERSLNAGWAVQRRDMLGKLRYVQTEEGYAVETASAGNASGSTPQSAYNNLSGWSVETDSSLSPGLRCSERYYYHSGGYWHLTDAEEITRILPAFHGITAASAGVLIFEAGAPEEYGSGWTCVFDPLGTTISSGVNSFVLSGGVFASWGYGSATIPADASVTENYSRGWEARNVRIIYDYNTTFDFREE